MQTQSTALLLYFFMLTSFVPLNGVFLPYKKKKMVRNDGFCFKFIKACQDTDRKRVDQLH